tara:strand:- start:510 stop:1100 length:591 start_codon:yes stop_codon:yes gene_type:complete
MSINATDCSAREYMTEFIESIDELISDIFSQKNIKDILEDKNQIIYLICTLQNFGKIKWKKFQDKYKDHPRLQKIDNTVFRKWYKSKVADEHKTYIKEQFKLHMTVYNKKKQIQNIEIVKSDIQNIDFTKIIQDLEKENAKLQNLYDIAKKGKEHFYKLNIELEDKLNKYKDTEIIYLKQLLNTTNEINILKSQLS